MRLLSTRDRSITATAAQAFLQGIAPGGGLFVPEEYPLFPLEQISALVDLPYEERVACILTPYLCDYTQEEILSCVRAAYCDGFGENPAPLVQLPSCHVLELWHGPTSAFKDMALQLLPHLMSMAIKKHGVTKEILILVATSGDTGKAALEGFAGVPGTRVVVFYPEGGVSQAQRLQMLTQQGDNVHIASVRGNFDDTQTAVKRIFADEDFIAEQEAQGRVLSSANSINFGRLLPQVAYYFSAYADLLKEGSITLGESVNFVVPTGNFGNILAAWYAMCMGLPVHKLICASNSNNVLADFMDNGTYDSNRAFHTTSSPSMDILISSNLERLLYDLSNRDHALVRQWMDDLKQQGRYTIGEQRADAMKEIFYGGWADDACIAATIAKVWKEEHYLLDTHTAVARAVYDQYLLQTGDDTKTVIVSTASPFKFAKDVLSAIEQTSLQDDFACASRLEELTLMSMPPALKELPTLPVLHNTVCDIADMRSTIDGFLTPKS